MMSSKSRRRTGVPINVTYSMPDAFSLNERTPIKLSITYARQTRVGSNCVEKRGTAVQCGRLKNRKESYRAAFGRRALSISILGGAVSGGLAIRSGYVSGIKEKRLTIRPGQTRTVTVYATFGGCQVWPTELFGQTLERLLQDYGQPRPAIPWPGYECVPGTLKLTTYGKIRGRYVRTAKGKYGRRVAEFHTSFVLASINLLTPDPEL